MSDQATSVAVINFTDNTEVAKFNDSLSDIVSVCDLCAYGVDSCESPPDDYGCDCPLDRPIDMKYYR